MKKLIHLEKIAEEMAGIYEAGNYIAIVGFQNGLSRRLRDAALGGVNGQQN